ncbi:hypothetical protein JHD49_09200 [Sulfurimonas sp. SAG-AH-194-C21]|nr:hypothetical protein [Sulfurimonas sp. SAG-AH-194-C21]
MNKIKITKQLLRDKLRQYFSKDEKKNFMTLCDNNSIHIEEVSCSYASEKINNIDFNQSKIV